MTHNDFIQILAIILAFILFLTNFSRVKHKAVNLLIVSGLVGGILFFTLAQYSGVTQVTALHLLVGILFMSINGIGKRFWLMEQFVKIRDGEVFLRVPIEAEKVFYEETEKQKR